MEENLLTDILGGACLAGIIVLVMGLVWWQRQRSFAEFCARHSIDAVVIDAGASGPISDEPREIFLEELVGDRVRIPRLFRGYIQLYKPDPTWNMWCATVRLHPDGTVKNVEMFEANPDEVES